MSVTLVSSSLLQRRKSQKEACRSVLKGQERETQQYVISGSGQKDLKLFILLPPLPPNFFAFNAEAKAGVGSHPFFSFFGHAACGILVPTQRWNLYLLHCTRGVSTTGLPEKSQEVTLTSLLTWPLLFIPLSPFSLPLHFQD